MVGGSWRGVEGGRGVLREYRLVESDLNKVLPVIHPNLVVRFP